MIKNKLFKQKINDMLYADETKEVTDDDLLLVKRLVINKYIIESEYLISIGDDLLKCKNLESIVVELMRIDDDFVDILSKLKNLKNITINMCKIDTQKKFENTFENAFFVNDSEEIIKLFGKKESLKSIRIEAFPKVDVSNLISAQNLLFLEIYNSDITNISQINKLPNLCSLKLDGSSVDDEMVLNNLPSNIYFQKKDNYFLGNA